MKKLLALTLAALMLLNLAACSPAQGDDNDDEPDRNTSSNAQPNGTLPDNLFGDTTTTAGSHDTTTQNAGESTTVNGEEVTTTTENKTTSAQKGENTTTKKQETTTTRKNETTTTKKPTTTTTKKPTTTTTKKPTTTTTTTAAQNVYQRYDNNYITAGEMSINPRYVYWRNGNLVAECFVINGTSNTISRLCVDELTFKDGSGNVIASANFGEVRINPIGKNQHQIVTFTFGTNDVRINNARLSPLNWYFDLRYM